MNRLILSLCLSLTVAACDDKVPSDDSATDDSAADDSAVDDTAASEDLNLSPGFGTQSVTGTADGSVGDQVCPGRYPAEPQHTMTLSSAMTGLGLALDGADLVIMVTFNASTFCSDVETGVSAIHRGSWSAGEYAVYVGVPDDGAARQYTLTATEG